MYNVVDCINGDVYTKTPLAREAAAQLAADLNAECIPSWRCVIRPVSF